MENISQLAHKNCNGCSACCNACPVGAISMVENEEGFLYPTVNKERCINCGLCVKSCSALNNNYANSEKPECYAYMADDEIRKGASSGGVFPVIADYFIKNDGYVCGAVYDELKVKHIVSNNVDDIERMRGSKYLQSDINDCYKDIKILLDDGNKVLFTGTPCQISGLKFFLGKASKNLYCIDIVCHGVPSPKVFQKYINEKIKDKNEKWLHTNFRDKFNGLWSKLTITTTTTTTTTMDSAQNDIYMRSFLSNLCLRNTCTNCKFQTIPRQGDITIGDFWGIWQYNTTLNDEKGTSVILKNNYKGGFLIDILKNNSKIFEQVPIKYAIDGNLCLVDSVKPHKDRKLFFKLLNQKKLNEIVAICLEDKVDYLLVNFWDSYFNYGAMLTAYALQELVKELGYTSKLLDIGERTNEDWFCGSWMAEFAHSYLNLTKQHSFKSLKKLTKKIKGVILGSDQVLRLDYIKDYINKYLLNFVHPNAKKIAISASFGMTKDEYLSVLKPKRKYLNRMRQALKEFDYLSGREDSSVEVYKDLFGLNADNIIDPVFLIDKKYYEDIISTSKKDYSGKVVFYVLDFDDNFKKIASHIEKTMGKQVEILEIKDGSCKVQDWLKAIATCEMFITDSFHGLCFSLIFNKPVKCLMNKSRGMTRFESLNNLLGIEDLLIENVDDLLYLREIVKVDYSKINEILLKTRFQDIEILRKVLAGEYSNNPNYKVWRKINEYNFKLNKPILYLRYMYLKTLKKISKGSRKEKYEKKLSKIMWR